MNKFWKWMEKKGYVVKKDFDNLWWCSFVIDDEDRIAINDYDEYDIIPNQMLIGYKVEYLKETTGTFIGYPSSNYKVMTIDDYSNIIDKEINRI